MNLYELLKIKTQKWREEGYKCKYPAIAEIFDYNFVDSGYNQQTSRFLRKVQFEALEVYWYLRLKENTLHIFDLYKKYFGGRELFEALGLESLIENLPDNFIDNSFIEKTIEQIKNDDEFVKKYRLEGLR